MKGVEIIENCTETESCNKCSCRNQCQQFLKKLKEDLGLRLEPWELNEAVRGEEYI